MLATLLASAVLYRQAGRAAGQPLGLAVWRLLMVWLLTLAFFTVLASLLFVVLLASAYAVASAGSGFSPADVRTWAAAVDARGRAVLAIVGAAGLAALAWAMTRVALGPAATVALGRLRVLSAWPLTRRLGWRLLAARVAILAPAAVLAALAQQVSDRWGAWFLAIIAGLALGGLALPLNIGLMTYIYQRRATDRSEPDTRS
jgi:hypothetical protein